jgi:phenylalanyl-tRNA synthetase beta chain
MRIDRCRKVVGVAVPDEEIAQVFQRLGLPTRRDGDAFVVTPPSYRFDLEIEEDLIEEVARLWGFDRIPAHPPLAAAAMRARPETQRSVHAIRSELALNGYQELVNFSFVDASWEADFAGNTDPIRVLNPIASQLAVMRTTLIGGLVGALRFNLNRKSARARLFEMGRVFRRDAGVADGPLCVCGIDQPLRVAGLAYGAAEDDHWAGAKRDVDFFDVKGDVERLLEGKAVRFMATEHPALHPGRSAAIEHNDVTLGVVGELHPRLQQKYELLAAPVVFELDVAPLLETELPHWQFAPRFPVVLRDLALWFDASVSLQRVLDTVNELMRQDARLRVLREFRLFDVYRAPAGDSSKTPGASANALLNKEKSLAFRVVLQDTERTLSEADADAAIAALREGLRDRVGARLR